MHKLKKKKGKKTVTHHFSHIKEHDGSKKHVYLGTDPKKSEERLTKLKVERIRSSNRLIKKIEAAQEKMNRLGHYNRPYDDIMTDIKRRYQKQREVETLIDNASRPFPFSSYAIIFGAVISFSATFHFLFTNPSITGSAVQEVTKIAANKFIFTALGMFMVILIMGFVLHAAEHKHKTRHDEYKHPEMLKR